MLIAIGEQILFFKENTILCFEAEGKKKLYIKGPK
jgi:hypothetical protein